MRVAPRTFARPDDTVTPAAPDEVLDALHALRAVDRDVVTVQEVMAQLRDDVGDLGATLGPLPAAGASRRDGPLLPP